MKWLFMLLVTSPLLAQNPVYKPFEVDQVARPQGGDKAISDYLKTSMRKPVTAQVDGIAGRVIVTAVVEPDGRVTDVRVLKGLRADADSEAVRVFSTFNAWRPAVKAGLPVRQYVSFPIMIDSTKKVLYQNGAIVNYFDREHKPAADTLRARYKSVFPMLPNWLPTGDAVLHKRRGSRWLEEKRYVLTREELPSQTPGDKRVTRLSYQTPDGYAYDNAYEVDETGVLRKLTEFGFQGRPIATTRYAPNGAQIDRLYHSSSTVLFRPNREFQTTITSQTAWFASGQIRAVASEESPVELTHIYSVWDSSGRQLVTKGTGTAVLQTLMPSETDPARQFLFIETGAVENGLKTGVWRGRLADGSYFPDQSYYYEERYKNGMMELGASIVNGDTAVYNQREQPPQFSGGDVAFRKFLDEELPQLPGRKKKVGVDLIKIGFTVQPGGTLSDYVLENPVLPDLDQKALAVAKATEGQWKPGTRRGRPVLMRFFVAIPANRL